MKIVTVNIPESFVDLIDKLVGNEGLYPSRSELIRCAVREFIIKEMKMQEDEKKMVPGLELDPSKYVQVPIETINENNEKIKEFKTYKIVRRLEF